MSPLKKAVISLSVPLGVIFILCVATLIICFSLFAEINTQNAEIAALKAGKETPDVCAYEIAQDTNTYILREHEGIIGIFGQSGELIETVDVYVRTLPERDRQLLKAGIFAASRAELMSLIEDYSD